MVMFRENDSVSAVYYLNRALEVDSTFTPAAEVLELLE